MMIEYDNKLFYILQKTIKPADDNLQTFSLTTLEKLVYLRNLARVNSEQYRVNPQQCISECPVEDYANLQRFHEGLTPKLLTLMNKNKAQKLTLVSTLYYYNICWSTY